jgi:hypothetical protein
MEISMKSRSLLNTAVITFSLLIETKLETTDRDGNIHILKTEDFSMEISERDA